ncbi:TonB-dependent receptor [Massilia sp. WF1]|uniref:TonB-dependent siderophore receptor n=1 Tax=unclassified Massilia TaxID=2609279 RepID=UPI00064B68B5|nr:MULTISPECIES: TonB-dependent siderophore receptor [unclassified Massilia]ALK98062.1 TonB-dependent receptor [Massilia sp. WG5]KLU35535.1 TonB-dependent receptor [Massilia sp. WF1]
MNAQLKYSILACAIAQAFSHHAQAQEQSAQAGGQPVAEVVVTGERAGLERAAVGGFSESSLWETPASISTIGRTQMQDLSIRSTTEAMRYDASVSDAYNAVGYAEQFAIRGFALDNNYSYRKDGFAIPGDTQIPLENKERIEVLKGLAGLTAGVATPGGIVNYVTKRPTNTPLRSATVEVSERGTLYGTVDLGGRFDDRRFGYRINAAAADLHSYVRGANGERQFVSGAFDWQITPDALLQLDLDYQHKAQITAPGFQLIRNEVLPTGVSARMLLNDQPWTRPVDTRDTNLGLRFEYKLADSWRATIAGNKHWFKRDDYTAFPYGCSNEGAGFYPGYCSNGDYDVYDYQSVGERKTPWGLQAMLQGGFATGALRHQLTVGASYAERHDSFGDYVYDYVGYSNLWHPLVSPSADPSRTTGPVFERRSDQESALFAQDIVTLAPQLTLHGGLRYVQTKRSDYEEDRPVVHTAGYVDSKDHFLLPSVALVYNINRDWNVYGSVSHGLQHGGVAPMETANENQVLEPGRSKQLEVGAKGSVRGLNLSASLFQIRQGLEYTDPNHTVTVIVDGEPVERNPYVRGGRETHRGFELSADGKLAAGLQAGLSLMALNTRQDGTGDPGIDGKRVTDVPSFKSTAWVEYAVPQLPGLKLDANWQYSGKKAFDVENRVFVPDYHVFGLGAAYATNLGATKVTLRARVDNLFDKFYWRDVTPALGGYLLPGAPRSFRVSGQFDF